MKAQYASNLQNVNDYIKDAEESAQADPNDEEAQQIVMDAYEQRATVYEMALDRSLPYGRGRWSRGAHGAVSMRGKLWRERSVHNWFRS